VAYRGDDNDVVFVVMWDGTGVLHGLQCKKRGGYSTQSSEGGMGGLPSCRRRLLSAG
jgi:hypothetical protein